MENMPNKEKMYFDPAQGKLLTSKPPNNDQIVAVDMNKPGSGGFFHFTEKGSRKDFVHSTLVVDLEYNVEFIALR